jgi:hypothetical protein
VSKNILEIFTLDDVDGFYMLFVNKKVVFLTQRKKRCVKRKKKLKNFILHFSMIFCFYVCYQTCISILFVIFEKFFSARKNIFFLKSKLDIYINVRK